MEGIIIKKYNDKLGLSKIYTEEIINSISEGIMTTDLNGNVKIVNKVILDMFGYTKEAFQAKKAYELFEGWEDVIKSIKDNNSYSGDVLVHSKKNVLEYNLNAYSIYDSGTNLSSIVYLFKEIKRTRKQADKIAKRQAIYTFDKIIGQNKEFVRIIELAKKISNSRSTILITGESGTGKEVFAQSIHNHSNRQKEPFIALNCGAIPNNLIESELFGYEEGAFTGAKRYGHPGKFELADGGTIFLDEIGAMPLNLQTRLLRVIEEGIVSKIGSTKEMVIDVRIIAATNMDLSDEIKRGNFREDLYYRLNVLPLRLLPLRERREDIPLLLEYFMNRISKRINKKPIKLPKEYIETLIEYNWPGNIRELENLIELILNTESIHNINNISDKKVYRENSIINGERDFNLENLINNHIITTLDYFQGNITNTAKALGIGRNTLYRRLEKIRSKDN